MEKFIMQSYFEYLDKDNAFSLEKDQKAQLFPQFLKDITLSHYKNLKYYQYILDGFHIKIDKITSCNDIPYLPARFFKEVQPLHENGRGVSVSSSGTTGSKSHVYLNESDILFQKKVLFHIVKSFIGKERRPMIVLSSVENGEQLSAKSAGVLGFMLFGRNVKFASNQDEFLSILKEQTKLYGDNLLIYGTTIDIYHKMIQCQSSKKLNLSNSIIIMGGGWKNSTIELTRQQILDALYNNWRIRNVYDFYGMAEQTGSIYFCCEFGHYHCSDYSDIIVRHPITFEPCSIGEMGIIQVLSALPTQQPSHSLLTEDFGMVLGNDDCKCGRKGKYFTVGGRIPSSAPKGCSYEN